MINLLVYEAKKNSSRLFLYYSEMGTHSDGYVEQELLTTFVTCEGDLSDPQFNTKFARLLKQLKKLLLKGELNFSKKVNCFFKTIVNPINVY